MNAIQLSENELNIISKVKEGIKEDAQKGPWSTDKWYRKFTTDNLDNLSIKDAPINEPLMVVTESLGTLIKNDRGQSIVRGSLLIKTSDNEVYCFDGQSWYGSETFGAITFNNDGCFKIGNMTYGGVKPIKEVNVGE